MSRVGRAGRERGSVTAELAVALTGVVLVLGGLLAVAAVSVVQVRVVDAAGAGARAAARGEPPAVVQQVGAQVAGTSTRVTSTRAGDLVTVTASRHVTVPLVGRPVVEVRASAVALVEVAGPGP